MNNIASLFRKSPEVKDFLSNITSENKEYSYFISGVTINHSYLLTYSTFLNSGDFVVYVASNVYKANQAYVSLQQLAGLDNVNLYVVDETMTTELLASNNELQNERINTLNSIFKKEPKIIVTHINAILKPLIPKKLYESSIIKLKVNDNINIPEFTKKLITMGYTKVPTTYKNGEFSVRGEVIDIFPMCYKLPVRINFFDEDIENLREFDIATQKSINKIDEVTIIPHNEILIYNIEEVKKKILRDCTKNGEDIPKYIQRDLEDLENYNNLDKMSKYMYYISREYDRFLNYLDSKIVVFDDTNRLKEKYEATCIELNEYLNTIEVPENLNLMFYDDYSTFDFNLSRKIYLSEVKKALSKLQLVGIYDFEGYKANNYDGNFKYFTEDIKTKKDTVVISLSSEEKINLIKTVLDEGNIKYTVIDDFFNIKKDIINIIICNNALSYGIFNEILVLTDEEVFRVAQRKVKYRSVIQNSSVSESKEELEPGDYVVHYDYGIGQYLGFESVTLGGITKDYLKLKYANIEVFAPVENINLLEKYQGSEGSIPKLTTVGTNDWEKKKNRVREQLASIARDLIDVQIQREKVKGAKYSIDSPFQKEFENDFEFEETKDQLSIVSRIKEEMEKGLLIDRLICGDVGYGKTEIAMRIAFKTIYEGKQVAFLAPTTILTRQHFYTFKERFEKYGIKVALLNRLVTEKEQKKIVKELKEGAIDLVVGTHRLLSSDISFKDLGLLVVDEEQRFGVVHKEAIKKMKVSVNVLVLTATPIPRTLQLAVTGVRQLSVIETAPLDRYPIQTYVLEYNDIVIKEAIYRELNRGGQIFYLHNRIADLERTAKKIRKLVPEVRICIGHGKMDRNALEDTIQAFIDHEYDLLLCTTIIETGIDIPNTNTLIIDEADKLGLAQMYQIRGRVGRSDKIAYAYMTYEEDKVLDGASAKRLAAIMEYTKLGSGYKIAVRDLAIRGAGDILGREQSGFINSVGIDMYMKLLNEALNKVKGIEEKEEIKYKIDISRHIENSYVSDDSIKIYIHKEITSIESLENKMNVIDELTDRFGKLSEDVLAYIEEIYLESTMRKHEIKDVMITSLLVTVILPEQLTSSIPGDKIMGKGYKLSERFIFEYRNKQYYIKIKKTIFDKSWIFLLSSLFEEIL